MPEKRRRISEEVKLRLDYEQAKEEFGEAVEGLQELFGRLTKSEKPMHESQVKEVFELGRAVRRLTSTFTVR